MRLILRVLGTWLLGIALVLLVVDGTKSLAASTLVMTPLIDWWTMLSQQSLAGLHDFLSTRMFGAMLVPALDAVLNFPGFAVAGVLGVVFAILGRSHYVRRRYVRTDEF